MKNQYMEGPGQEQIRALGDKAEKIMNVHLDKLKKRYSDLVERLGQLQEEKDRMEEEPLTKKYLLEMAKAELQRQQKETFMDGLLVPHFRKCQKRESFIFEPKSIRALFSPRDDYSAMLYSIITEKDLEEAIDKLPDVGLSIEAKEAKCKQIDDETRKIQGEIEKEFNKLSELKKTNE